MVQKNTTQVGYADIIALAELIAMNSDNRKGSPSGGVFSPVMEKTHQDNERENSMGVDRVITNHKRYTHA